jgi:hypothetical protein
LYWWGIVRRAQRNRSAPLATKIAALPRYRRTNIWEEISPETLPMSMERWIRLIAGVFVTLSVALAYFHSRYWLLFTLFVGLNLFQSALTRWCLMEDILTKLGVPASRSASDAAEKSSKQA